MISLIVLNVTSSIYSQNMVSYRGLSLGNIIADDLDLIYDPIELQFVEGVRVYTNLSNATSGEEKLFVILQMINFFLVFQLKDLF